MKAVSVILLFVTAMAHSTIAFSPVALSSSSRMGAAFSSSPPRDSATAAAGAPLFGVSTRRSTRLHMSDKEKARSSKKGLQTLIKEKTEEKQEEKKEEQYRVLLHNDEVHTFQYVVRSLTKVIGTLDRKAAFEICVETHGRGKAIITKTWKKQAMQFCMGLQRQGLTVSITPDEDFDGGHWGGGNV
jgi:ATP-dependent Clp protease adapter protein ClpS